MKRVTWATHTIEICIVESRSDPGRVGSVGIFHYKLVLCTHMKMFREYNLPDMLLQLV